ncbi:hypothetical protein AC1031_020460 [Aphanomyces cochlioides]|nr:hypothetical protein AC1031_020460 [Aphanomyces cochlioides]
MLTLFCVVVGEGRPFSIEIDAEKTVDHLKKKIKKEKEYKFPADELQLYSVDGLAQDENEQFLHNEITIDMPNCSLDDFGSKKKLATTLPLSLYPQLNDSSVGRIHVLVVVPDELQANEKLRHDVKRSHEQSVQIKREKYVHSKVGSTMGTELLGKLNITVIPVPTRPFTTSNSTLIDPFIWESVRNEFGQEVTLTEEQQRQRYLLYVEGHVADVLAEKNLCVIGVEKKMNVLSVAVPGHNIDLAGRTDLLVLGQVVQEDPSNVQYLPEVKMLIEVKRLIQPSSDFQALSELIALDLLAVDPVMALLTDLNDNWRFFWVADKSNTKKIIHKMTINEPGKAFEVIRRLLGQPSDQDIRFPFCERPLKRRKLAKMLIDESGENGGIYESIQQIHDISSMLGPDIDMARAVAHRITRSIPCFSMYT